MFSLSRPLFGMPFLRGQDKNGVGYRIRIYFFVRIITSSIAPNAHRLTPKEIRKAFSGLMGFFCFPCAASAAGAGRGAG